MRATTRLRPWRAVSGHATPAQTAPARAPVTRTAAGLLAVALALAIQSFSSSASAASGQLPGGRSTYVVSVLGGPMNAMAVRLAIYQFSADGTVSERYWAWRQNSISGDHNNLWAKVPSGYTTAGCLHACPIRTPVGFQSGKPGTAYQGRWSVGGDGVLSIHWTPRSTERWSLDASVPGVIGARLLGGNGSRGWGLGSNAGPDAAVDLNTIYDSQRLYGPLAQNAYGTPTQDLFNGWHAPDYQRCSSGLCMSGVGVTAADKRSWFSSYLAANPAVDGRKVYWNNQQGSVQQMEAPGSDCISANGGGHTDALLQALDDNGRFVGWVGVEASLNKRRKGQAVVGAFAMVLPSVSSAIS